MIELDELEANWLRPELRETTKVHSVLFEPVSVDTALVSFWAGNNTKGKKGFQPKDSGPVDEGVGELTLDGDEGIFSAEDIETIASEGMKPLTAREKEVAFAYAEESFEVNYELRAGHTPLPGTQAEKYVSTLDKAIAKSPLSSNMVLYRGISDHATMSKLNQSVGKTIRDPGYMSTSIDHEQARGFGYGDAVKVVVPAGTHGLVMEKVYTRSYSGPGPGEHEVLLPRGQSFSVSRDPDNNDLVLTLVA